MKNYNYLDNIPVISTPDWYVKNNLVTIRIKANGIFYKLFHFFTKQPEYTFIHLDTVGSFIWNKIDGKRKISDFASSIIEKFGSEITPVYPRLARFFYILKCNGFIQYK